MHIGGPIIAVLLNNKPTKKQQQFLGHLGVKKNNILIIDRVIQHLNEAHLNLVSDHYSTTSMNSVNNSHQPRKQKETYTVCVIHT